MPYAIVKLRTPYHISLYKVINKDTGFIHSKHTTLKKAEAQVRLLNAKER